MPQLEVGMPFPSLTGQQVGGESMTIPNDLPDGYSVLLFYRASW